MTSPRENPGISSPSSPPFSIKRSREAAGFTSDDEHRQLARGGRRIECAGDDGEAAWYSAISSRSYNHPTSQDLQLPTPRTHGSTSAYPFFPAALGSPESPLSYAHPRTTSNATLASRIQARPNNYGGTENSRAASTAHSQIMTPFASPASSGAAFSPPLPMQSPKPTSDSQGNPIFVKTEPPSPSLAPADIISLSKASSSTSVAQGVQNAQPALSSPFIERARPNPIASGATHAGSSATRSVQVLSSPRSSSVQPTVLCSPAHIEERERRQVAMPTQSSPGEIPRQPGGELNRIRSHMLSSEDAIKAELETRRPEYLKRLQRGEDAGFLEQKIEKDGLGIAATPAKGRRIQLFDFLPTSEESFEESLMTNGYGTYGEPRTPRAPLSVTEGLSKEAMDWLAQNTPVAPSSHDSRVGPGGEPDERELKKRKRLEAFRGSTARAAAKLYPTEVEGLGRILWNEPATDIADDMSGTPAKKRAVGKKKRAAGGKGKNAEQIESTEPRWLDKEIPWCLREKEREEELKARDADRLKCIDKYLEQDTDSDDEKGSEKDDEDFPASPWAQSFENVQDAMKRGRGKAIPLQADPTRLPHVSRAEVATSDTEKNKSLFFPSEPADARTALMSKRSVRLLTHRKMRRNGQRPASLRGIGEGRLACTCGREDDEDGRPAVQCDDCYNWHHLECIGVHDESELGEEDDPWFCPACIAISTAPSDWRTQRQPTFVPTEDRPVHSSTRNDVAFYSSSPLRDWDSSSSLHTPVQGQGRLREAQFFRRSIWDDPHTGPDPSTPVTLSRGVHVFSPGEYGHVSSLSQSGYPMFETSYTTPKNMSSDRVSGGSGFGLPWTTRSGGGMFRTPTSHGRLPNPGSVGFGFAYTPGGSSNAQFSTPFGQSMYASDDTPIRRAPVKETKTLGSLHSASGVLEDSPLAGRGDQPYTGPGRSPDTRNASTK